MHTLLQLLAIVGAVFLLWWLYQMVKTNPEAFSSQNLSKSFFTMGILALGLIAFVALLVVMVRSG